jgi:hypothetical protein
VLPDSSRTLNQNSTLQHTVCRAVTPACPGSFTNTALQHLQLLARLGMHHLLVLLHARHGSTLLCCFWAAPH